MQVAIGFGLGFGFHWLKTWREFCWPITERSDAKPKQTQVPFYTQVNTALTLKPQY